MTFKQLVWKMAKSNKQKYIFYYFCNSFAVMFFFLFATIYFNEAILATKELESIEDVLIIPGVALIFYTIFFVHYAHRIFIKRRKKEFSLFMTLGMSNRDVLKLLLMENSMIACTALVTGILAGTVLSRLVFLILINSVGLDRVPFHLSFPMFSYTALTYLLVFIISIAMTSYTLLSSSLTVNLKSDRYVENFKHRSPLLGAFGICLVIGSSISLYITFLNPENQNDSDGLFLLIWTIAIIGGLYIALSQCMSFMVDVAKKFPSYYFKRVLFFSSLENKFRNMTAIMLLVSVMSMVTIFYTSMVLFFVGYEKEQVLNRNPYDVVYIQSGSDNNLSDEEIHQIVDKKNNPLTKYDKIRGFFYEEKDLYYEDVYYTFFFLPFSDFTQITNYQGTLDDNEYIYYINDNPDYAYMDESYSNGIEITSNEREFHYSLKDSQIKTALNIYHTNYLVVTDSEFDSLRATLSGMNMTFHLLNIKDWQKSERMVEELRGGLKLQEDSKFGDYVYSKIEDYNRTIYSNSIMFFVTVFVGVLFFLGSFFLLYLNVFSNIEQEKERFQKLHKIGITKKEIKQLVNKELRMLFFFAPILGSCLAFVYILTFAKDGGGLMENLNMLWSFLIMSGSYLFIQVLYYFYASKKMMEKLKFH